MKEIKNKPGVKESTGTSMHTVFCMVDKNQAQTSNCSNASQGLQERVVGALWGLSVSEANSIAIGQEGGVAPLIALASSDAEDVHETAVGALWNLAFNAGNAFRIVEEGGVPALVNLCSSSVSKMARFMAALALSYMFDGRMDKYAQAGPYSEGVLKTVSLDGARCSGAEIGRFVTMLRHPSSVLKICTAFALLQFTVPGGRHATYHANLMQKTGAQRLLRASAAAASAPVEAKVFSKIVLRNLENHFGEVAI